jgi:hypothetical protein
MATEVIRCSDCGAVFKGVPTWLATAKVKFTCTSCPKRSSRSGVRFEPAVEPRIAMDLDGDPELGGVDLDGLDDADLDLAAEDMDAMEDDKEI